MVRTEPSAFKDLLTRWLGNLSDDLRGQLLVVDGKRLRGVSDSEHITHVVELFAADSRLILAQEKVPKKSGEARALPALLSTVNVEGALVSMDALYAQVTNTQAILQRDADYLIGIKGNQPTLEAELINFFS